MDEYDLALPEPPTVEDEDDVEESYFGSAEEADDALDWIEEDE